MSDYTRLSLLLVAGLATSARAAVAQDTLAMEFAAKIVCGALDRPAAAPGQYFTAINIHNPNADSVAFHRKYALTEPGWRPGRIIRDSLLLRLQPDQALEVDCTDLLRRTRLRFVKGFAVIQSPRPLDIVAVYSAAGSTRQVETMDVERVAGRRLAGPGCPDLVVDSILRPVWDGTNNRSVITAIITEQPAPRHAATPPWWRAPNPQPLLASSNLRSPHEAITVRTTSV